MSIQQAACEGKRAFGSMEKAYKVARKRSRSKAHRGGTPYHCPHCGKFHIGSDQGIEKRPDRRREILEREGLR